MKAIRGATTVEKDKPELIREAVCELLEEIERANGLVRENIVCIFFSTTGDLHSIYPAKIAREYGYSGCALFSAREPYIYGALKKCIRIMILTESDKAPTHVYLREAKELRRDLTQIINIALDGPAGSGKSTVAKILSKKLNLLYLDTGAMYRACAMKCIKSSVNISDEATVANLMERTDVSVDYKDGAQITYLDGIDVSEDIRKPEISMLASTVSAIKCVREIMVEKQREIAEGISCVLDGRDIGTNVLPNAEFKFYLTATPEVRAKRRYDENLKKGFNQSYEDILKEIIARDEQDKNRTIAPLKKAADAVEIDTTDMSLEQVTAYIEKKIQEKI